MTGETHPPSGQGRQGAAELQVVVLDHDLEPRRDALVEISHRGTRKWTTLSHDDRLDRYTIRLAPGPYDLRVNVGGMEPDRRTIQVQAGENTVFSSVAPQGTRFYLGVDEERVFFKPDEGRLLLCVSGSDVSERFPALLEKHGIQAQLVPEPSAFGEPKRKRSARYLIPNPPIKADSPLEAWQELEREMAARGYTCQLAAPLLRGKGIIEGLTNEFVVRFKPEVTPQTVEGLARELGCEIVHRIGWMANGYLLRVSGLPGYDVLKLVEAFRRRPGVIYAEPNVLFHLEQDGVPSDYLLPEQTYGPVIHAQQAWNKLESYLGAALSAGSPDITVAVYDVAGVSPNHPDLTGTLSDGTAKMVADFDFAAMANQTVANLQGDHGTACASVAAGGFNNGLGFPGIAGNCHLIGAQLPANGTGLTMAYAWIWSAGLPGLPTGFPAAPSHAADVLSNSWGAGGAWNNTIRDALDYLTIYGRGGKGCIVVFSVGNLGYVQFSPIRRYAAYFRTIAVGASISANPTNPTDSDVPAPGGGTTNLPAVVDTRAYYSPYGPEMDLVAPSHTTYLTPGTADPVAGDKVDPIAAATLVGSGHWIGRATTTTHLSSAVAAGATSLPVASTAGLSAGAVILIGTPGVAGREFRQVTAVGAGTLAVPALTQAHPSGTAVMTGPNDYDRSEFGGTSHSCPTVAGAAALILSVRPELTWIQVRRILHENSDRIDVGQTNAQGQWVDNDGDGIAEFSQWYGFGRLNLERAVQAAHDFDASADIVLRDNLADTGPVPSGGVWYASPDLWVSSTDVPVPSIPYTTDPTTADPSLNNAVRGHDNYVFVRVKNVGTIDSDRFYVRALIAHYPGFEFRYPQEWMPTNAPGETPPSPLAPGTYLIGEQPVDSLAAGQALILKFTWPANLIPPDSVTIASVTTQWHPCLLAEVSPHDGPAPAASGWPVQRDNNLAQRNISVSGSDSDSFAAVAGSSDEAGVQSLILDRSHLGPGAAVFVRIDHEGLMKRWIRLVREKRVNPVEPIGAIETVQTRCKVTLMDAGRLQIACPGSHGVTINATAGTSFLACSRPEGLAPRVSVGHYQGVDVVSFEGGADAIELPLDLAPRKYVAVVIGVAGAKHGGGALRVSQRLQNGGISAGYEIRCV